MRLLPNDGYRRGLLAGVAAAIEHHAALRSISFQSALDVGANMGQFSLVLRAQDPNAVIHAFEPLRGPARTFERLFAGDANVILHHCAAGERTGEIEMHVSGKPDSSSLLPITREQSVIFPGTAEVGREMVAVRRADEVIDPASLPRPLLIKLDVQGFELSALRGMPVLLDRAEHVYAEISFIELYQGQPLASDVIGWLADRGFCLAGIYNLSLSKAGTAVQADALFRRRAC